MLHVHQRPRRRIHPRANRGLIQREIGCTGSALIQIHGQFEFINMEYSIHVMHVFLEQLIGRVNSQNGLERRRLSQGHLDGIEASPGDSQHAHVAV